MNQEANQLLETLRDLIAQARQQVLRSVDVMQVQTYWQIGRHIVEFEQVGKYEWRMASNYWQIWQKN